MSMYLPNPDLGPTGSEPAEFIEPPPPPSSPPPAPPPPAPADADGEQASGEVPDLP